MTKILDDLFETDSCNRMPNLRKILSINHQELKFSKKYIYIFFP